MCLTSNPQVELVLAKTVKRLKVLAGAGPTVQIWLQLIKARLRNPQHLIETICSSL